MSLAFLKQKAAISFDAGNEFQKVIQMILMILIIQQRFQCLWEHIYTYIHIYIYTYIYIYTHEGHLESKERFAIQRYLLIIGKKQNMQVL